MNLKFKLINSLNKETIGYEYLTEHGWYYVALDMPERIGTFDHRELGDGFFGIIQRRLFTGRLTKGGAELYEGDVISPGNVVEFSLNSGFTINGDRPLYAFEHFLQ